MESRILKLQNFVTLMSRYRVYFIVAIGLLIGFTVSSGLLLYNGKELVNALIYLFFVVILPFCFSMISFFILLFRRDAKSVHSLKSSYLFGFFFSIGALIALLFTITVKDIAFGWATTLAVTPQELVSLFKPFELWSSVCSSCTISVDLAQMSQFNRLGGSISSEQIVHAKFLGAWWQFLALAIIVYGVIFRLLLWLITLVLSKKESTLFSSEANQELAIKQSNNSRSHSDIQTLHERSFQLLGYHIDNLESLGLVSHLNATDIVVVFKSWEPPILDMFDYLEQLHKHNPKSKISLYLIGLNGKKASRSDLEMWQDKLDELNLKYEVIA